MFKFLRAPKRLLLGGLKKRSHKSIKLSMVSIDTSPTPQGGQKAIADTYMEIYQDPYLNK